MKATIFFPSGMRLREVFAWARARGISADFSTIFEANGDWLLTGNENTGFRIERKL